MNWKRLVTGAVISAVAGYGIGVFSTSLNAWAVIGFLAMGAAVHTVPVSRETFGS